MSPFKCPRCGGAHFGTYDIEAGIVECHNDTDGKPFTWLPSHGLPRPKQTRCGWRGHHSDSDCGLGIQDDAEPD